MNPSEELIMSSWGHFDLLVLSILYYKKSKNRIFFIINQEILFIKGFSKVSLVYLIL